MKNEKLRISTVESLEGATNVTISLRHRTRGQAQVRVPSTLGGLEVKVGDRVEIAFSAGSDHVTYALLHKRIITPPRFVRD